MITDNLVYENGLNGILVHRSTKKETKVIVEKNLLFSNGKTSKTNEYRQAAGGLHLNSGDKTQNQTVKAKDNIVYATEFPTATYSCFGTCGLTSDSANNVGCGATPYSFFNKAAFATFEFGCDSILLATRQIRGLYPDARAPKCPQWQPFIDKATEKCQP